MRNSYKSLVKNTSIFALGALGSKLIVFLIAPFYTYVMSTSDYGTVDILTSSVSLLIPFTTLLIYEAALRFLIARESSEKTIFNNCFLIFIVGNIIALIVSPFLLTWLNLYNYYWFFVVLLIFTNYTTIFGQFLRAKDDSWGFAISGVITTIFTVIFNIIFLFVFKKGIEGYFYSLILAQLATSIFVFVRCRTIQLISYRSIDYRMLKNMLAYSLPLVPNNIMWWIMNAGDKYVINFFLGTAANGIISVSYKIPTILTTLFSIFMQAWQISAVQEMNKETRNDFFKNVFKCISLLLFAVTMIIILFVQPLFAVIIDADFMEAWKYVPFLCVANLFNCMATFAGVVYITEKRSVRSFVTTLIGAIVNLVANFLLIQLLGLFGVAIGTVLGYFTVMILRFKDFKKYYGASLYSFELIASVILLFGDAVAYVCIDSPIKYIISAVSISLILVVYRREIKSVIFLAKNKMMAIMGKDKRQK